MFQSINTDKNQRPNFFNNKKDSEESKVTDSQVYTKPGFLPDTTQLAEDEELQEKASPTQKAEAPEEDEKLQLKSDTTQLQEEEELQMKKTEKTQLPPYFSKGKTGSLPDSVQSKMEHSFGTDFSNVNVHTNDESATQIGALAYTQGENVHFAPGQYNPESQKGQELIGHELTHVVQQRQGKVQPTSSSKASAKKGKQEPFFTEASKGNINDSPTLEKEADDMGAKATQGKDISNQIKTKSSKADNKSIQMLQKDKYPWHGVVSGAPYVSFRSRTYRNPNDPSENRIGILAEGTKVKVIGKASGWNQVEATIKGVAHRGYIYHTYVDDATALEMTNMLGDSATWVPSGPNSGNTFQKWASAASEGTAPSVSAVTTINCWEMVLLAAYKSGALSWQKIHNIYTNTSGNWYDELPNRITNGGTVTYDQTKKIPEPTRGDVVFFNGASHVSLATGNGDEIFTFWPPPNTAFTAGGTLDDVKLSTIKKLSDWMTTNFGSRPVVTFGAPAW